MAFHNARRYLGPMCSSQHGLWASPLSGSKYYILTVVVTSAFLALVLLRWRKSRFESTKASLDKGTGKASTSKHKDRPFGEWIPVDFSYPVITPCEKILADIQPVPYRPFKWGAYHVTMGIRSMDWDNWIELDNQYERYQRIRAQRVSTRGEKAVRVLGDNPGIVRGGGEAAVELVHELAEYLSRRYPLSFHVTRHHQPEAETNCRYGWDGAPPIKTITAVGLNITHELPLNSHDGEHAAEGAMSTSALLIQDDLAIMIEGTDGHYYFQAGAICVPGSWRMDHKIGKTLDEIHTSGNVPQYQEKLQPSLEKYFGRLTADKPVARNNYSVQVVSARGNEEEIDPDELAWSYTTNGPEDDFDGGHQVTVPSNTPAPTPEMLRLRVERQTLRRLPKSGGVVFTIRTYIVPMEEVGSEPGVPERLASAIKSWSKDVAEYKGRERAGWGKVLVDYLDRRPKKQGER